MATSVDMNDASVVARVRKQFGLDDPILVQFGNWLSRFVAGDWGTSIGGGEKVYDMFMRRLPVTLELFLGATLWSIAIGIPAGIVSALRRNSAIDITLTTGTMIGVSIPSFWEAIMLIYLLAVLFPIVPPSGYVPLTTGEFALLKVLVQHPRVPLSRDKLMELARGREYGVFDRSIDVQVSRLRKLLEEDPAKPRYIQTVWGVGYVFVPDDEK